MIRRLLREPLAHFLVIGLVLFVAFKAAVSHRGAAEREGNSRDAPLDPQGRASHAADTMLAADPQRQPDGDDRGKEAR